MNAVRGRHPCPHRALSAIWLRSNSVHIGLCRTNILYDQSKARLDDLGSVDPHFAECSVCWNVRVSESALACYGSVSKGCAGNAESAHSQPSSRLDAACRLRLALIHSLASMTSRLYDSAMSARGFERSSPPRNQLRFIAALYSSKVISASSSASKVGYKMPFKWSNSC